MKIMTRFILLFIYVWAGPSWGVITSEVKTYNYDVVTESIVNKNVKLNQQNFTYDDTQNFHYCCSESLNSSQEVKALVGSFFAFEVGLVAAKGGDNFVDLTTPARRRHILEGDATGGGHRPGTEKSGKSEFPAGRPDDSIIHDISDIATDPTLRSRSGRGGRTIEY